MSTVEHALLEIIEESSEICAVVCYGVPPATTTGSIMPLLSHVAGPGYTGKEGVTEGRNEKRHYYSSVKPFFAVPAHENYHGPSASVAHTRTLSFLKPLVGGPYFDLEQVWDEHTYWEFEARSVEETMATMVEEPYVNHIPTLTGGIGRAVLTEFYRDHFIFSNPPDTELKLVSRTVGIDRVVDEFLFEATHDRTIDWLYVFPYLDTPAIVRSHMTKHLPYWVYAVLLGSQQPEDSSASPLRVSLTYAATGSTTNTLVGTKPLY